MKTLSLAALLILAGCAQPHPKPVTPKAQTQLVPSALVPPDVQAKKFSQRLTVPVAHVLTWDYPVMLPDARVTFEVWWTRNLEDPFIPYVETPAPPVSLPMNERAFFKVRARDASGLLSEWGH